MRAKRESANGRGGAQGAEGEGEWYGVGGIPNYQRAVTCDQCLVAGDQIMVAGDQ